MKHDNIHETPDVSYIHNEGVAHEHSDVNVKAIAVFTFGLMGFVLFTLLLIWMLMEVLEKQALARPEDQVPPMAMSEVEQRSSDMGPRLQAAPGYSVTKGDGTRENLELRAPDAEYRVVHAGWLEILEKGQEDPDSHKQIIIPIEQAKKQLLESGALKSSAGVAADAYDQAEEMPSGSSAGRMNEKRMQ